MTSDAVDLDTPARAATSLSDGRRIRSLLPGVIAADILRTVSKNHLERSKFVLDRTLERALTSLGALQKSDVEMRRKPW
jgi:hypothetical protein